MFVHVLLISNTTTEEESPSWPSQDPSVTSHLVQTSVSKRDWKLQAPLLPCLTAMLFQGLLNCRQPPLLCILPMPTAALAGNQLPCPGECRSSAGARRASRVVEQRLALLMWCGELSVGGVCRCRGLGCNYSQWLSADYISSNVPPSASILMELDSVAECIGALQGHCSESVRGVPLTPRRLSHHSGPRTGFATIPPSVPTLTLWVWWTLVWIASYNPNCFRSSLTEPFRILRWEGEMRKVEIRGRWAPFSKNGKIFCCLGLSRPGFSLKRHIFSKAAQGRTVWKRHLAWLGVNTMSHLEMLMSQLELPLPPWNLSWALGADDHTQQRWGVDLFMLLMISLMSFLYSPRQQTANNREQ